MLEGLGLLKLHEEPAIVFFFFFSVVLLPDSDLRYGGEKIRVTTKRDYGSDNRSSRAASTKFGEIIVMYPFARRTTEEKLLVKNLGTDKPEINISQHITVKDKCY